MKVRRFTLAVLAATLALVGSAQAADRADLKVKGSVKVKGGDMKGSLAIRNNGDARSKKTTALLSVVVPGKDLRAASYRQRPLASAGSQELKVNVAVPSGAPSGAAIRFCADRKGKVKEESEKNNCRDVGSISGGSTGSSVPTNPIAFEEDVPFELKGPQSPYWIFVPSSYDESHQTPTKLFLWMHGCGGQSGGDIYNVSPGGTQDWISVSLGGRDGACWNMEADQAKVLGAIADVKTHFNVSVREVILGGYSSGGDLAYRTAFYNSREIAGVLAEDTTPFRDSGSTQQASIAAATHKFDVVHLAHLQDTTYPIATVRAETDAMIAAGFPLQRIEVNGTHYDNPGAVVNGQPVPGTDADIGIHLLPHIGDGWTSPG